ncbi:DUF294 nucleotidyltransferase-like domain-containing protein [Metabacillus arenae]|uniref:CBS domain-containing protein n=1 Tax=Metabacillus arenae TaxID=2771434 RepID=A0A926NFA8_9BACI|nr:DUF294 nucleotidyltransferase-like domain-containing protein [Metabacillus arenae]MBD1380499.1 hypothetical protein [Metabacillus arenae]
MDFQSYESIKEWKIQHIHEHTSDTRSLNDFHDEIMKLVFELSLKIVSKKKGPLPCKFSWFVMGSAGRYEQGIISDQDHGLVFEKKDHDSSNYFQILGEEIALGLHIAGYPYCEGKVMSSNPLWCKGLKDWEAQLADWMETESWESIRYSQIFFDGRVLAGDEELLGNLKQYVDRLILDYPKLLSRFMDNIMHINNSIGPFGQIFVEPNGRHQGSINIKRAAFIPYVNAVRILAIKEGIHQTSTLTRLELLSEKSDYARELQVYKESFLRLLDYRLALIHQVDDYEDVHFLSIKNLNRSEKKEMKQILKNGKQLHQYVHGIIEKGVQHGL